MSRDDRPPGSIYGGQEPKSQEYKCVVPGCRQEIWAEMEPDCKKHKIRMKRK